MAWQPHENALNHPFRNAFSGRALCREDSSADAQLSISSKHKDDASWELTLDGSAQDDAARSLRKVTFVPGEVTRSDEKERSRGGVRA